MTHRQETATGTEQQDRETPEKATSGPLSDEQDANGAQDAETPERVADGRVALRTQLDTAVRDREVEQLRADKAALQAAVRILKRGERQQRTRAENAEEALTRARAFADDMRTWCSPRGIAADYADRLLATLDTPAAEPTPPNPPASGAR